MVKNKPEQTNEAMIRPRDFKTADMKVLLLLLVFSMASAQTMDTDRLDELLDKKASDLKQRGISEFLVLTDSYWYLCPDVIDEDGKSNFPIEDCRYFSCFIFFIENGKGRVEKYDGLVADAEGEFENLKMFGFARMNRPAIEKEKIERYSVLEKGKKNNMVVLPPEHLTSVRFYTDGAFTENEFPSSGLDSAKQNASFTSIDKSKLVSLVRQMRAITSTNGKDFITQLPSR